MAGAVVEVKYFNSFVLKKTTITASKKIIWNGSFGIPKDLGGYSRTFNPDSTNNTNNWIIEEARIRGGYNNTSVDLGVKAYLVEDEPNAVIRSNSLIYSGIFNSTGGVNRLNQFIAAEKITKDFFSILSISKGEVSADLTIANEISQDKKDEIKIKHKSNPFIFC